MTQRWHAACDSTNLGPDELLPVEIDGRKLVLVRINQSIGAFQDRCPHRFAPLSMGKVVDGTVQCVYHGLRFGPNGNCVHNPHGNGAIPAACSVATYPVEERGGTIYVGIDESN